MLEDLKEIMGCLGLVMWFVGPLAGWFIADRLWKQGELGATIGFAVTCTGFLISGLFDFRIRAVLIRAIIAWILSLPLVYMLVLIVQLVLLLFHSVQYISFQNYFLKCIPGVLLGSGLSMLWTLKGTFKIASEKSDEDLRKLNLNALFFEGFSFRIPFAVLVASLTIIPEAPLARIILGTFWGVVFAVTLVVYSTLIKKEPLEQFWYYIFVVELVLMFGMVFGVLYGVLIDRKELIPTLELFPPACVACIVTYLLILLYAFIERHIRGLRREKARETI